MSSLRVGTGNERLGIRLLGILVDVNRLRRSINTRRYQHTQCGVITNGKSYNSRSHIKAQHL